jgi:hypothetical protein
MEHHRCECGACQATTEGRPPNKAFWAFIVAFWVASVVLGFGASRTGWSFVLVSSWASLACSVILFARRASSWTCVECGSVVAPPLRVPAPPLNATFRAMPQRHA